MLTVILWIIQPALVSDAGQSAYNGYTLTVWAGQDTVDPGGSTTIYATLVDSTYLGVSGVSLNFSAVAGDGTVQTTSASTDGSGQCAMGLTLGSFTTQVNVFDGNGYNVSTSCVVTVNPPPPNYQMSIAADKNPVKNGETTTVRVRVADVNSGSGLSGCGVNFRVNSGDATLGALSASTDGNGWCSIPVTAGSQPSQITVDQTGALGIPSNSFTLLCPSLGDTYNLSVTADQNPLRAGGGSLVQGSFTDATLGLPISGRQLKFTVLSGDGTLQASSTTTNDSGNYDVWFQGGSQPTTIKVTACDASGALTGVLQTLTMGILVPTYPLSLSSTQSMLQAGQQATLSARLIDADSGQPVSGAPLNFQVTGGGDGVLSYCGGSDSYTALTSTTDTNGSVSLTFTGGYLNSTISVTDPTFSGATQSTVIGTVSTNTTGHLTLSSDASVLAPYASTALHTSLWDATTGTAVSGGSITYTVTSGDGGFSPGPATQSYTASTDGNGHCDLTFYGGASPSIITATAANYAGATATCTMSVQAVTSPTYSLNLSSPQSSLAPNATTTVSAQLWNSTAGQPMSGATLTFQIGGGDGRFFDGTNPVTSIPCTTDANGVASVTFAEGSLDTTVSVTDGTYSGATRSTVIAALIPKDSGTLTLAADVNVLAPGVPTTLHATLVDTTTGTAVSGGPISYLVTSGNGGFLSGSSTTAITDGNGNCDLTFYGGSSPSIVTATASNYAGAMTTCTFSVQTVVSDTISLSLSTSQSSLVPGASATVSAQLVDSSTGPVSGSTLNFQIGSGDGRLFDGTNSVTSAPLTTDANGSATITFVGGGHNTTLSVTDSTSGATQSTVIAALILKDAGSLTLWADDNVVVPGAPTVLHTALRDTTASAPASGGSITYQVTSGDGVFASGAQTVTVSADANGNCDIAFNGGSLSSIITATASDYADAKTTYTFGVQVVVPDTYSLTLSPAKTVLTAGDTSTVTAQLLDVTTGNPVPNVAIRFTVAGGDATVSSDSATTDNNGNCSVTLTGGSSTSTLAVADQGGYQTSISCVFNVGHGYLLTMSADQTSLLANGSTTLHLLLVNANTYPPTPVASQINLSDSDASAHVSTTSVTTAADGTASLTFNMGQQSSVTVSAADASGDGTFASLGFTLSSTPVYQLTLVPDDASLLPGQQTNLRATLIDTTTGSAVSGTGVSFLMRPGTAGGVSGGGNTGDNGQTSATFIFGSQVGVVDVVAGPATASYTFYPAVPPCGCGCGGSPCANANGCTSGSCKTIGPCGCGCGGSPCANADGCTSGSCKTIVGPCSCGCGGSPCANANGCNGGSCKTPPNNCSCGVSGCAGTACAHAANPAPAVDCGCGGGGTGGDGGTGGTGGDGGTGGTGGSGGDGGGGGTISCSCGVRGCAGIGCSNASYPAPTTNCGCTPPAGCPCGGDACGCNYPGAALCGASAGSPPFGCSQNEAQPCPCGCNFTVQACPNGGKCTTPCVVCKCAGSGCPGSGCSSGTCTSSQECVAKTDSLTVTASGPSDTFVTNNDTFTASASGGKAPYTYSWSVNHGTFDDASKASPTVTWSLSGVATVTVSVTDSNGDSADSTVSVNVYRIESSTFSTAPDDPNHQRTKLGVGEKVLLSAYLEGSNTVSNVTWNVSNGDVVDSSGFWTVGDTASDAISITATINSVSDTLPQFSSVAPNLTAEKEGESIAFTPQDSHAHMFIKLTLKPTDVSFSHMNIQETDGGTSNRIHPHDHPHPAMSVGGNNVATNDDDAGVDAPAQESANVTWTCIWQWNSGKRWINFPTVWQIFSETPDGQATHITVSKEFDATLTVDNKR